jgi:hypothetical protein
VDHCKKTLSDDLDQWEVISLMAGPDLKDDWDSARSGEAGVSHEALAALGVFEDREEELTLVSASARSGVGGHHILEARAV